MSETKQSKRRVGRRIKVTIATIDGEVLDMQEVEIPSSIVGLVKEIEIGACLPDTETPGYLGRLTIGK